VPPAVSVILPVYNGAQHLREGLDSILNQSFTAWELVAVDDGSSDACPEILREYARADSRISVTIRSKNLGITATLNECCQRATGDLIAVTNQDDVSLPERLAAEAGFLRDHPEVGAVGSQAWLVDGRTSSRRLKTVPTHPGLVAWSLVFFNPMIHPSVMMRAAAYRAVGGYPPGYGGGSEDYAFFVRLAEIGGLANLDRPLLEYRIWAGNVTALRWEEQESQADRIVTERAAAMGVEISRADARELRGLSTGRYPASADAVSRMAGIVEALLGAFATRSEAPLAAEVKADAGIRLCLLAALAVRHGAVGLGIKLAARATRIDGMSAARFVAKAGTRVLARNG
jgi:glycosyltransferase involved in cell wall biosynthesis